LGNFGKSWLHFDCLCWKLRWYFRNFLYRCFVSGCKVFVNLELNALGCWYLADPSLSSRNSFGSLWFSSFKFFAFDFAIKMLSFFGNLFSICFSLISIKMSLNFTKIVWNPTIFPISIFLFGCFLHIYHLQFYWSILLKLKTF